MSIPQFHYADIGHRTAPPLPIHAFGDTSRPGGYMETRCGLPTEGAWHFGVLDPPRDPDDYCKDCFPQDFVILLHFDIRIHRP